MADEILSVRTIFKGWINLLMLHVRLGEEEVERPVVGHPSGAVVLPYDADRRVALLVRQTRPPVLHLGEPQLLEAIAGALDGDEAESCARREALEEGGLKLRELEHLGRLWPSPATSTERVDYFLAAYSIEDRVAEGGGLDEEDEHVRVREVPLAELWQLAEAGDLPDAKLLTLLQALRIKRPDLFA